MSSDLEALRGYVTYESGGQARSTSTVLLHCTHSNLKARLFEIRLDRHMTVERVKEKLRAHVGTGSAYMHLTLLDENGQVRRSRPVRLRRRPVRVVTAHPARLLRAVHHHTPLLLPPQVVADMIDDDLKLGYFSPMDGWTIHITDLDPHSLSAGGALEDVSLVKKYEISEEDYAKRENNFRNWKADKKKADPNWCGAGVGCGGGWRALVLPALPCTRSRYPVRSPSVTRGHHTRTLGVAVAAPRCIRA